MSIFCFCKDRAQSLRRCIESVLGQSYTNLEFVVQDGASTDGTLEILRSYDDPRIKLVSEPDSGHEEAFWKALNRCQGDIIGSCLSDEELLPHAVEEAVEILGREPRLGAITRDGYTTDPQGNITGEFIAGEFDFVDYLFGRYCPMWVASFFRRQALLDIGLQNDGWTLGCIEFEMWCRLAMRHGVKYVPGIVAKYGVDAEGQLSNAPKHFHRHRKSRKKIIEKLFSAEGFFGDDKVKKIGCLYRQDFLFYNHARTYRMFEDMKQIHGELMALADSLGSEHSEYDLLFSDIGASSADGSVSTINARTEAYGKAWLLWLQMTTRFPRWAKLLFGKNQRAAIRRLGMSLLFRLYGLMLARPRRGSKRAGRASQDAIFGLATPAYSNRLYHEVANIYYERGNLEYADFLWSKACELADSTIDSLAVQAALFSPSATNESLALGQRRWAARHAKPLTELGPIRSRPFRGDRRIRIGYYCSFFDSHVARSMFTPVARCHDSSKFHTIAYSVTPAARDIEGSFDEFKSVGVPTEAEFVRQVRSDQIDIFVEMSGFSPMHRFAAMASRCAPIQIAHFNHSGTSGVPNVDYVFADLTTVLPEEERHYTERVWRLEGDFLFFNYEWAQLPQTVAPPSATTRCITFGCFGSAPKLNDRLIELWARVLEAVPRSQMYIRNSALDRRNNLDYLIERFARHGIAASRLRLGGATEWDKFIRSYEDVDISLDTWPYAGANTVGESIWQGVPVITLAGDRFSSRLGASHLKAAGCSDLIASTADDYVRIAAALASDGEKLTFYRNNLRTMAFEHGLSDPERFARKLERAYVEMMSLHREKARLDIIA